MSIKINLKRYLGPIEYIIISIILLMSLLIRYYKINSPIADWHSFRQADTASVGKMYLKNGTNLLFPRYHDISTTQSGLFNPNGYRFVELPLFAVIHSTLFQLFGEIPFDVWGRLVSVLTAVLSTFVIFLLGRRIISSFGGLLASAFYAFLPFNIFFTRIVLPEPLSVTFGLLGLLFFLRYYDKEANMDLFSSSIFLTLGILIKPYIIFYGVPILYLVFDKYGFNNMFKNKKLIIALLVVVAPFVFWRYWINQFPEGIPFWKWTFNGDDIRFRPSFWRWIFGERLSKLILGYWGIIPFIFGLTARNRIKYFVHFFLLGMFLYVSIFATANVRHDYYQTIAVPAISLALASGVLQMWNYMKEEKWLIRGLLVFSLFIAFVSSASEIKEFYKINNPIIIEAGQAVKRIVPDDSLIIAPYNGDTAFLYQTGHSGWPVVDRPIDELIEKGAEYFVSVDMGHYQTVEFSQRFKELEKTKSYVILKLESKTSI